MLRNPKRRRYRRTPDFKLPAMEDTFSASLFEAGNASQRPSRIAGCLTY
jgi:hypothetical protein